MPKITFVEHDGTEHIVAAEVGQSLMQVAVNKMVPGIIADCGGFCNCATCHCYVAPEWSAKIPVPADDEREMAAFAIDSGPESRLSCQIRVTPELDGMVVRLPKSQM